MPISGRGSKSGVSSASTNKSGKSTMHPKLGMTWKRALKIERIARLSADPAGYSNEQIGNMLNCTAQTVILIRQTPEYHAKMIEIASGVVSQYDAQLRENIDNMREELRTMVPSSMMVIRNALTGKYGHNLAFKAATEVLDREGTNAKVSKSTVAHEIIPPMGVKPEVVSDLMQLLAGAPTNAAQNTDASGGFTLSAQESFKQQLSMNENTTEKTLEELDLSNKKPN
jgi:hypothetical protein